MRALAFVALAACAVEAAPTRVDIDRGPAPQDIDEDDLPLPNSPICTPAWPATGCCRDYCEGDVAALERDQCYPVSGCWDLACNSDLTRASWTVEVCR